MSCCSFCGLIGVLYLLSGISNVYYDRFYATKPVLTDCSNIQNNQMCECPSNNITEQTDKGNKDNNQLTMMNDTKSETQSEEKETSKDMDVKKRTLPVNESKERAPGSDPNQEKARPGVPENSTPTTISNLESQKPEGTESLQPNLSNEFIAVWMLCLFTLAFFCGLYMYMYVNRKADNEHNSPENEAPELNLENSVTVASFTKHKIDLHLRIARTVTEDSIKIHPIYVGETDDVSSIIVNSKVCLVFVDKNDRNIILETDADVTKCRRNLVKSQVKRDSIQVIVIYCQHEDSNDLPTLYNRDLGNIIKRHVTLKKLQRHNRVLSIDKQFSPYQANYLKCVLNEAFT